MVAMRRWGARRVLGVVGSLLLVAALVGCGADGDEAASAPSLEPMFEVAEETISHDATQQVLVFSPEAEGPWPVVHLFTDSYGSGIMVAELARTLAAQGVVVFAPDYRADNWGGPTAESDSDLVCAWRYGNSVAAQYGGDVEQSVTLVGWGDGADQALELGLRGDANSEEQCFTAAPDPGAVAAIAPCRNRVTGFDPSDWTNTEARVVLRGGSRDRLCPRANAEYGAEQLQAAGFDATLTTIDGGDHGNLVFRAFGQISGAGARDPDFQTAYDPGNPRGMQVAQTVLDAIDAGT